MSSVLRSRAPPASASAMRRQPALTASRKPSDVENQVTPFYLDDGTDDHEEIRRRRYSSSASSSSDSDYARKHGGGGSRGRGGGRQSARRPHARSYHEKESEWEKASNGRAEDEDSEDHTSDSDSSSHERSPSSRPTAERKTQCQDEPESPRRAAARKKTQQSESESNGEEEEEEEEEEELRKDSVASTATTATHGVPSTASAPSTPRTPLSASELASLSKLAVFPGSENQLLQAHVRRVKTLLHSQYHFYINDQLVLMAEKQPKSRTPNYYLFDMTRAAAGVATRLTKKSGNYIGKLRSNFANKKSVLIGNQSRKTELAAVLFSGNVSSSEPRRLVVVLPPLNAKRQEIDGLAVGDETDIFSVLAEHYKTLKKQKQLNVSQHHVQVFENKQPVFENGFYRLNFHGRVSVPSIKNFQLVRANDGPLASPASTVVAKTAPPPPSAPPGSLLAAREDGATVYLQFGKVDENKFHLDFRAPVTPIQAFAIALAQFNL